MIGEINMYALKSNRLNGILFDNTDAKNALVETKDGEILECDSINEALSFIPEKSAKYYAIKNGSIKGIFYEWDVCKTFVIGFPSATFKSFKTINEAIDFMGMKKEPSMDVTKERNTEKTFAYVDGSYNANTRTYGYGVILVVDGEEFEFFDSGTDEDMASMRNVAGEILGSMVAINMATDLKKDSITIYYDYEGIEKWATGVWKRNKKCTQKYYEFIQEKKEKIQIHFCKVKAHSGIELNNRADKLAKQAVGIK
jgi:ribonuclease HI